jgi:hypothetical protein
MGRAGVDLAIKEAQDRMNFRSQELARGGELSQFASQLGQQGYGNLSSLYGQQQEYGLTGMNRQANAAWLNAQYQSYPYQARLGDYYGTKSGLMQGAGTIGGALVGGAIGASGGPMGALYGAGVGAGIGGRITGGGGSMPQPFGYGGTYAPQSQYDYAAGTRRPLSMGMNMDEENLATKYPYMFGGKGQ